MTASQPPALSRREREIMDALYRRGSATAAEVRDELADPPGYSTVRKLLEILETKGHVVHSRDGNRYVYQPRVSRTRASRSALRRVVGTFFEGRPERALEALLDMEETEVSDETLARLEELTRKARGKKR
ncbi:MAG: BlaI/MecI/CopY family transcriptional regulator [Gemmatimonadales bacterium]